MFKGSCLCQKVQYQISQLDTPITRCYCQTCRKANASDFVPVAGVKHEHFQWISGEGELSAFESSPGKQRLFCRHCGSHLLAQKDNHPYLILRVATLDQDPGQLVEQSIWLSHKVSWLEACSDLTEQQEY